MKIGIAAGTGLFVIGVLLGIVQLWGGLWNPAFFMKMEMTVGALLAIVAVITFVSTEYRESRKNSSGDSLDE